jgi:hypothetical protein
VAIAAKVIPEMRSKPAWGVVLVTELQQPEAAKANFFGAVFIRSKKMKDRWTRRSGVFDNIFVREFVNM